MYFSLFMSDVMDILYIIESTLKESSFILDYKYGIRILNKITGEVS